MWLEMVPYLLMTVVLVVVPGLATCLAAGFRVRSALGLAPLVSSGIIGLSAIGADTVGLTWGLVPIGIGMALCTALAWGCARLITRLRPSSQEVEKPKKGPLTWVVVAAGLAGIILLTDALRIVHRPDSFSQTFDNIYHLNVIRWIMESGNGSSLNERLTSVDGGFYPLIWHDIVAAASMTVGGVDVAIGTNALIIVSLALIWPWSMLALLTRLIDITPLGALAIGILATSFAAFPYLLVGFGVLYPNLYGMCLLPAAMALLVSALGLTRCRDWPLASIITVAPLAVVSLGLSHPNVAITLVAVVGSVLAGALVINRVVDFRAGQTTFTRILVTCAAALAWWLLSIVMFIKLRPGNYNFWVPPRGRLDALVEALTMSPLVTLVSIVPALLTLVGFVVAVRTRQWWWVALCHLAFVWLWLMAASQPQGRLRYVSVGLWYSDPYRLAALLPISGLPLAVLAVYWLEERWQAWRARRGTDDSGTRSYRVVAAVSALVLGLTTQLSPAKEAALTYSADRYWLGESSPLVSQDEYQVIQEVPGVVPRGDRIVVNPWNGSSMVYAFTGELTTATHIYFASTPAHDVINASLDEVATNPEVCPALAELQAFWVLDFGQKVIINGTPVHYDGWEDIGTAEGFELVLQHGDAALYRITACD